jgi:c-di-GMP-binding flagellar brake protein YcgR
MHLLFFPSESVRVYIPAQPNNSAEPEIMMAGRVVDAMDNTLCIVLNDEARHSSGLLPHCARFIISKRTPFGILEFDANGHSHWEEEGKLTLEVKLLGTHRSIQRRAAFRIELRSAVCYRDLAGSVSGSQDWKIAELHDVSLGGISLLLQDNSLEIGHKLVIEFALNSVAFSASAVVRRIEVRKRSHDHLYGLEYLDADSGQQDRMARAMVQLQMRLTSSFF